MKNKIKHIKVWTSEHLEDIFFWGMVAGSVGAVIALAKYSANELEQEELAIAAYKQHLQKAVSEGASVLPGPDGEYWIIPKAA